MAEFPQTGIKLDAIKKIALAKGLVFAYDEAQGCFVMRDKRTHELLAEYADCTVRLITNTTTWRIECNKLKSQAY